MLCEFAFDTLPTEHSGHEPGLENDGLAALAAIDEMQPVGPQINEFAWRWESLLIFSCSQDVIEPAKEQGKNHDGGK
jgi:hypothetical protein